MLEEDMLPQKQPAKLKNLTDMSVAELEQYIEDMKAEIKRVEENIARKKAVMNAASSLFKS
ncbi:MAG TPA: DUF1192 domain-containing protein [Alphaproteobacteria bacterium]|nr:DUF1192 domain-containing protein [Micavibrio sp.]MBK9561591.1 DUF1192 domain-containing protein [Micavibrio sp.]HQX27433.1 DUF1192 domain-containing protein [Alphaproteobacteria bacterium]